MHMPKKSPMRVMPPAALTDPFDPSALGPLPVVPLVPEDILVRHKAFVPTDNRFRAAARLLQALWREDRELPIGSYVDADGRRVRLGSRITEAAGKQGVNLLSPEIALLVRRECVYRELGAMIEIDRLRANLLSSMPLTFNVFAPLKLDLRQATRFMAELFPSLMTEVRAIKFEHSPGRGRETWTRDYSALDLCIYGLNATGQRVMVGWEIKYSEGTFEPTPNRTSDRQLAITANSGLYHDAEDPGLFLNPHQQLTRELNLCQSILDNGDVDVGLFVLASPRLNHLTQAMGESFGRLLNPPQDGRAGFISITLERVLEALVAIGMVAHAQSLHRRYFDFHLVDGELELEAAEQRSRRKPKAPTKETPPPVIAS
jgi:hypothetical protein